MALYRSPLTVTLWPSSFFEVRTNDFHQPIKRTKQSALHRYTKFAYENREQRQPRFGPIRRIYALLDDRFDELPNQTENKSLDSC
ncbi:hypothetical protein TNCV_3061231 [Trichonephila clavipes]|nr:hypothetical protein TNCV_3061231 [Trichonephila clavipes]